MEITGALLRALLDASEDGIVIVDDHGTIQYFSAGAAQLFGYEAPDVLGRNVKMLMPEPYHSGHDNYLRRYRQTGGRRIIGTRRETQAQSCSGEIFPIHLSVGEAKVGESQLFFAIMRDLRQQADLETQLSSERHHTRELERSLEHVHRSSTLGEMAGGIAHEINQPLAAISSYADAGVRLLDREDPAVEEVIHGLRSIGGQAQRAGNVVRRMQRLARREEARRQRHQINDIIEDLTDLLRLDAREHDTRIDLDLSSQLPEIEVDAVHIQQVILNLVRNGLEAIISANQARKGIMIETTRRGDSVEVSVIDHGTGVPPAKVGVIFHPFQTTKRSGMGIGLSICATILQDYGGRIWYEPNPSGGSIFRFSLPARGELVFATNGVSDD